LMLRRSARPSMSPATHLSTMAGATRTDAHPGGLIRLLLMSRLSLSFMSMWSGYQYQRGDGPGITTKEVAFSHLFG